MQIETVEIVSAFDRDTGSVLLVNGAEIAFINFDEHGSAGDDLLVAVRDGLAKAANVYPGSAEISDEEFRRRFFGEEADEPEVA